MDSDQSVAGASAPTRRVQAALHELGLDVEIVQTAASARTAAEAALAVGAEVGQIVKSLVFDCEGEPVLALVSGSNRVDTARLGELAGGRIRRADADAVRAATGYAIGGVPPLAHARKLRTWCDEDLLGFDVVWAAAGTPHAVFPIPPRRLVEVTDATVAGLRAAT